MELINNKTALTAAQLKRNDKLVALFLIGMFCLMPNLAMAAPWDDMADEILSLLTSGFSRTIAIIVCVGLGFAAWAGKLTWGMAGRFVGGIVFIFGAAIIVDLFIAAV